MSDAILHELHFLGVDETSVEVLALLPLIQVAWADGEVQEQERETILALARERYHLGGGRRAAPGGLAVAPPFRRLPRAGKTHARGPGPPARRLRPGARAPRGRGGLQPAGGQGAGGFLGFPRHRRQRGGGHRADRRGAVREPRQGRGHPALRRGHRGREHRRALPRGDARRAHRHRRGRVDGAGPRLVLHGEGAQTAFPLGEGITVGRSKANTVQLGHDGQISRLHFRVTGSAEAFYLEDNGTTNGTFVNGEKVSRPAPVRRRRPSTPARPASPSWRAEPHRGEARAEIHPSGGLGGSGVAQRARTARHHHQQALGEELPRQSSRT